MLEHLIGAFIHQIPEVVFASFSISLAVAVDPTIVVSVKALYRTVSSELKVKVLPVKVINFLSEKVIT
jgi:hypothetical protein